MVKKGTNNTAILVVVIIAIIAAIIIIEDSRTAPTASGTNATIASSGTSAIIKAKAQQYQRAIELVQPDGYINADKNLTIASLIGKKVILVDFWTYSCINCIRTLPHLTAWYNKYKDDGFVIIGVHTPEFDFEKDYANVQAAVKKYGITYPVVQDNEYRTWNAYSNHYWPAEYLIDIDGFIVHTKFGEGNYGETEQEIQKLLLERKERLNESMAIDMNLSSVTATAPDFSQVRSPETYFGFGRGASEGSLGNQEGYNPGTVVHYAVSKSKDANKFYLTGDWLNEEQFLESKSNGTLSMLYSAGNINLVAGAEQPSTIEVSVDGDAAFPVTVSGEQLYSLYTGSYGPHDIVISVPKGVMIYTFTFG